MTIYGIDVSYAQGSIDWERVKEAKEFAIVRAGYGQNNIDARAAYNVSECNRLGIPVGLYWFSYAYSHEMARQEGEYAAAFAANYNIDMPIYWDFEYDSLDYAESHGAVITQELFHVMAGLFCGAVESNGKRSGLYYNPDFDSRFNIADFFVNFPYRSKWIAKWSNTPPDDYHIWQYGLGASGSVPGISTQIDLDVMDSDSPLPPIPTKSKMPIWFYLRPY